jgi:nucleotidyltransferase substrate binding protein (TIGR01987 family)
MNENKYAWEKLEKAWEKLRDGARNAKDELEQDGVIQRFEFTFELFWKTLKIFLSREGFETRTPKDSLKEAFRLGWVESEATCLTMLEDRNKTSHIYEKSMAQEILGRIKTDYISLIGKTLEKLKTLI